MAAEFYPVVGEAPVPLQLDNHPPLVPNAPAFSPMVPAAPDKSPSPLFRNVFEPRADHGRRLLPAGYHRSSLLWPPSTALEIVFSRFTRVIVPGDGPAVKSLLSAISTEVVTHTCKLKDFFGMFARRYEDMHGRQSRSWSGRRCQGSHASNARVDSAAAKGEIV